MIFTGNYVLLALFDFLEFAFVSFDDQAKQAGIKIMLIALETNPQLMHAVQALLNVNPEKPEMNSSSSALHECKSPVNDADLPGSSAEASLEFCCILDLREAVSRAQARRSSA
ncbi:hypothetical protein BGX30_004065 [Mortierella sp. GBA39]|nr:hypothetical protein BGX30_004065 [Mortierella sp. GBA39]